MNNSLKEFLKILGYPVTQRERNLLSDAELTKILNDLTRMKREEYEERLKEYDQTGVWRDELHEILVTACEWFATGLRLHRERPWLNPKNKKKEKIFYSQLGERRHI